MEGVGGGGYLAPPPRGRDRVIYGVPVTEGDGGRVRTSLQPPPMRTGLCYREGWKEPAPHPPLAHQRVKDLILNFTPWWLI